MNAWRNLTVNCRIGDALNHMNQAQYGAHYIIIYPDLDTLRELYSNYAYKQIEDNNEIVLVNPFYETTDSVRQVLSEKFSDGMDDVFKHEREKSLIIIDSLEEYFGKEPDMPFKRNLATRANQIGKNGLSILGDVGAYAHKSKYKDLVDYESSLPTKYYDLPMKGFCLYHQKDFDEFSDEQQQNLVEHHGKALKIIEIKSPYTAFFGQPLDYVRRVKEGQHIVLFYEELEYARMISFQFIKNGLIERKDCSYLSEEDVEAVKREMSDSGIDVNRFTQNNQLHIYQVSSLTDYHPRGSHTEELEQVGQKGKKGKQKSADNTTLLKNPSKIKQSDRIVLRCVYKVNTKEQIKSNLKWEYAFRYKDLKHTRTTVVSTYPVNDIIPTISDSTGSYGRWMNTLLELYDGVIFARRFWNGVAFNLN